MRKQRVEFRLTMPGVGSWNGRWSGEEGNYTHVRSLPEAKAAELDGGAWSYAWGDGWVALVSARTLEPGERHKKSDGFYGYEWMVDNIVDFGHTHCVCTWEPRPDFLPEQGEWEHCARCGTTRLVQEV